MHLLLITLAVAATAAPGREATPPPPSCANAHAHELDFWVGDWEIHRSSDGKLTGRTHVSRIDGCVIREEWNGLKETGGSLNAYDPDAQTWRRLWAGISANVGAYTGRWVDDHMEFTGQGSTQGVAVMNRLRLTPLPNGDIHQQFDTSRDGQSWVPFIDAVYRRVGPR